MGRAIIIPARRQRVVPALLSAGAFVTAPPESLAISVKLAASLTPHIGIEHASQTMNSNIYSLPNVSCTSAAA